MEKTKREQYVKIGYTRAGQKPEVNSFLGEFLTVCQLQFSYSRANGGLLTEISRKILSRILNRGKV